MTINMQNKKSSANLNQKAEKVRNINIDLIKSIAVLTVISVHFFLNNGFYSQPVNNSIMYISATLRTTFMVCVPLFMITTGYLMINKELSPKYYKGVIKTISIYLLASVCCIIYKSAFNHEEWTFLSSVRGILNFSAAPYSWYIEMYIGMFLLIPFLNLIYNNLKTDKQKHALIITLICTTALPSLFNNSHKIIPAFWTGIYPITYYFIGAHVRKSDKNFLSKWSYLLLFIVTILISSIINIKVSYNEKFAWKSFNDWGGAENLPLSVFLFIFLSRLNLKKLPRVISFCITKISEYSLGIYLVSYIFDAIVYKKFNAMVPKFADRLKYFIVVVFCVFIGSLILSAVLNLIYNALHKLCVITYGKLGGRTKYSRVKIDTISDVTVYNEAKKKSNKKSHKKTRK